MNHSTPGLLVHHQLPEFTQTHVHRVSDAIQPSHPLPSPSPPAPNPSQHQSLFQWINSSQSTGASALASFLPKNPPHPSTIILRIKISVYGLGGENTQILSPSVQSSYSVVSNSLQPYESQHTRPLCPSPTPGVHSDSRPSSQWCHLTISSSVVCFSCPQSLPASESFPMSQLFTWGGQSTGISALASLLPKNTQDWSPSQLSFKN